MFSRTYKTLRKLSELTLTISRMFIAEPWFDYGIMRFLNDSPKKYLMLGSNN